MEKMKRFFVILSVLCFVGVLFLPTMIWGAFQIAGQGTIAKWDFDLGEKRDRSKAPEGAELLQDFALMENYYNDRLPFRSVIISADRRVKSSLANLYRDRVSPMLASFFYGDDSYLLPVTAGEDVLLGKDNWLFYLGEDSLSYYRGTNLLSEETLREYADLTIQLQDICDRKGIRLQLMIVPDKEQVYSEYMPSYPIESEEKRVPLLVENLRENTGVNIIYPLDELQRAKEYWQLYCKYDTHWNNIGALVGVQALLEALGLETVDLIKKEIVQGFCSGRDLLLRGGLDEGQYPEDWDYCIDYRPEITSIEWEGGNFEDNRDIFYSTSDSPNGYNLVLLMDSYRFKMEPYVQKEFSSCVATQWGEYVYNVQDEIREADILVIAAVERYDYKIFETMRVLIEILSREE